MAKRSDRCFCWFPAAMLEPIRMGSSMVPTAGTWILHIYLLSVPRFGTLSFERFWLLFRSILNGVTRKTSNSKLKCLLIPLRSKQIIERSNGGTLESFSSQLMKRAGLYITTDIYFRGLLRPQRMFSKVSESSGKWHYIPIASIRNMSRVWTYCRCPLM